MLKVNQNSNHSLLMGELNNVVRKSIIIIDYIFFFGSSFNDIRV